jgi:hypothetical protein
MNETIFPMQIVNISFHIVLAIPYHTGLSSVHSIGIFNNLGNTDNCHTGLLGDEEYAKSRGILLGLITSVDIVFKRHIMAFDPSINLSTGSLSPPKLAASGYSVYCVWVEIAPGNYQIMYRRSTDGGASFGSIMNTSNSAGTSYGSAVSASEKNVYVVWHDNSLGEYEIMFRRSTDGGLALVVV